VRDARVRDDVVVHASALNLAHRLDLFAVLLGFVVLLAILVQPMVSFDIAAFGPGLAVGLAVTSPTLVQLLDETPVRFFAMLSFGMSLRSRFVRLPMSHRGSPGV
jgi:hypothetical protein